MNNTQLTSQIPTAKLHLLLREKGFGLSSGDVEQDSHNGLNNFNQNKNKLFESL